MIIMKYNDDLLTEKMIEKIYVASFNQSTLDSIDFYDKQYKEIQSQLYEHENNKPLLIFKNAHKNWEDERKQLNSRLEEISKILLYEYKEIETIIEFVS